MSVNYMKCDASITDDILLKARKEIGETPEHKQKCLRELRQLIHGERNFLPVMEDWFLIMFLRGKKYDIKKTFKCLKKFYEFKSMYSGTIADLKPSQLTEILEMNTVVMLPFRNKNGECILMFTLDNMDYQTATPYDLLAAGFSCAEILIQSEVTQIYGVSLIFDFKNMSFRDVMYFASPSFISLFVGCFQDRWPYRINHFHVVNPPSYFYVLYDVVKIFLSKELKEKVVIHRNNSESLHKFIPPDILPEQLGGRLTDDMHEEFRSYLYNRESIFDKLTKYTYDGVKYGQKDSESENRLQK